jgi:collagen triple helix repeat protein
MRPKFVVALAAVVVVLAGTATAGPAVKKMITGLDIKDGSLGLVDLSGKARSGLKGAQGHAGHDGAAGPAGAKGADGAQGLTGPTGPAGAAGAKGAKGDNGARGLTWRGLWNPATIYLPDEAVSRDGSAYVALTGSAAVDPSSNPATWSLLAAKGDANGIVGPTGPQGPQGPAGSAGATGAQGAKGDTGATGAQGATGATGATGPQGAKGDTGAQGPQGVKGDTGATGAQGPQGLKGDKGDTGATGAQGPKGDTGATGPAGAITGYQLVSDVVSSADGSYTLSTLTCPDNKKVIAGGLRPGQDFNGYDLQVLWSTPVSGSEWDIGWYANSGMDAEFQIICISG